ncbi:MAG: hypothetical protein KJZ79_15390 [Bryobacteraceae bacterium]|nr:hypothetical protein [Bryobacteraceae bacterium]
MNKGFHHLPALPGPRLAARLAAEAVAHLRLATPVHVARSDTHEGRGGNPRRQLLSAPGGPIQQEWYHSAALRSALETLAGAPLRPTGGGGTFSYYVRPGDHITIHRDILTCDFTLITCLLHSAGEGHGGHLVFWPSRRDEPLASLRAHPGPGAELLQLNTGESAALFGGLIPHAVLPVQPRQRRIVSLLCFETLPV